MRTQNYMRTLVAVVACALVAAGALMAGDESVAAVTNQPCVDVTSSDPYGFPVTLDCPFSVKRKLLDEAVEMAKKARSSPVTKARVGHMSHPGWSPGMMFWYEPVRTNQQSVAYHYRVYFSDAEEKRLSKQAGCGRALVKISAATMRGRLSVMTNEVFEVNDQAIIANVSCVRMEPRGEEKIIHIVSVPLDNKMRAEIQSLIECIGDDKYLEGEGCDEIESIAGNVRRGEEEMEIIPPELADTAFVKEETALVDISGADEPELLVEVIEIEDGSTLRRGSWGRPLNNSYIEYNVGTGHIDIRCYTRKYAAQQSTFGKIDGVWVKLVDTMICH
jgi:hypothetical protein